MTYNEKVYYEECENYSTSIADFTDEETKSLKKDAKENDDLFYLAVDYSAVITLVKYIIAL